MIFYKVKAVVSNDRDIRRTNKPRTYHNLTYQKTIELYRESDYNDMVILADSKGRFGKVDVVIISKRLQFAQSDALTLAQVFLEKNGFTASVFEATEILFAEFDFLLCCAENRGNIWDFCEIIDLFDLNQYYFYTKNEYLIREGRGNEEILESARKLSCAGALISELVPIFIHPHDGGFNHLPTAYAIQGENQRAKQMTLQFLLEALYTNHYLNRKRVCICKYGDGLVLTRLDEIFEYCAGGALVIDFLYKDSNFIPDPALLKTLFEKIEAERERVLSVLLVCKDTVKKNEALSRALLKYEISLLA
ncbi:MAG: hypothetical protein EOM79_02510 [Epsilonproteobacteria bacterium]|nr:hypothetical protein [Campylobacterota bacterium]